MKRLRWVVSAVRFGEHDAPPGGARHAEIFPCQALRRDTPRLRYGAGTAIPHFDDHAARVLRAPCDYACLAHCDAVHAARVTRLRQMLAAAPVARSSVATPVVALSVRDKCTREIGLCGPRRRDRQRLAGNEIDAEHATRVLPHERRPRETWPGQPGGRPDGHGNAAIVGSAARTAPASGPNHAPHSPTISSSTIPPRTAPLRFCIYSPPPPVNHLLHPCECRENMAFQQPDVKSR